MPKKSAPKPKLTRSQKAFQSAPEEVREMVKRILQDEREVMHLKTRPKIHAKILEHIKLVIR